MNSVRAQNADLTQNGVRVNAQDLCPHREPFVFNGQSFTAREVIEALWPLMTEHRRQRVLEIIANRTYTIVPVLEGLYDRGNVSAVLRSAEAMGYQAVHIMETSKRFKEAKRVTQGAEKWLDIFRWPTTREGVDRLKAQGYRILATHFENATSIYDVAFDTPTALVFGNEKDGVSEELLDAADGRVVIPMLGFAQSYNISVAAALCLYHIAEDRRRRLGAQGDLSADQQRRLTALYCLKTVPSAAQILIGTREQAS